MKTRNPEKFPFKCIRVFAGSRIVNAGFARTRDKLKAVADPSRPDSTVTTYHRTRESAEATSRTSGYSGYPHILKSARVEENK